MAKKEKRISINSIDKILKAESTENTEVIYSAPDGNSIQVIVKRRIPFQDFQKYVSCVADAVFIETDNDIVYTPENLDLAHILATLEYFTNIKSDMKIDKLYEFGVTDFYHQIVGKIDPVQYESLKFAIDNAVEYRKRELLASQKELLMQNIEKIESLTDTISRFAALLESVDVAEMTNTIQKIADKDERDLASAILSLRSDDSTKDPDQIDGQIDFDSIEDSEV